MQYMVKILKFAKSFFFVFILGIFVLSSNVLKNVPVQIEEQIRIYATIYDYVSEEERLTLQEEIKKLNKVKNVTYSTKEQELDYLLEYYKDDGTLEKLYKDNNPLQNTFIVEVNNLDYVEDTINTIEQLGDVDQVSSNFQEIKDVIGRSNVVITILNIVWVVIVVIIGIRLKYCKTLSEISKDNLKEILTDLGITVLGTLTIIAILFLTYDSAFSEVSKILSETGLKLLSINEQIVSLIPILLLFSMILSITNKCKEIKREDFE